MSHATDGRSLALLADRLRRIITDYPFDGREFQPGQQISISIGISVAETVNDDLLRIMAEADQALYMSKRSGKNRYTFYDPTPGDLIHTPSLEHGT
ncbi:GGDEF domain-containing protein [Paenibacillus koleovorans]|uniref:GGDEF domain-containing protein n=1 Tax=Paenibacillus koleovorans TaxID=121608 RepID=UPI0013E2F7DD|nr:diguanylate cyclase [Paenibacillus koleovorans]